MSTLRQKFNQRIFEWSTVGKSQFLLFFSCGLMVFTLSTLSVLSKLDYFNVHLNPSHIQKCLHAGALYCLCCFMLGVFGWLFSSHKRNKPIYFYSIISLFLYNAGNVFTMFMYGLLTMAIGISFSGGLILGLILLGQKKTLYSLLLLMGATLVLFYLYQTGHVQYAYVMRFSTSTNDNLTWTTLILMNTIPHIFCLLYFAAQSTDAWKERENKVIQLSLTDTLTGCYNRRYLIERLQAQVEHCKATNEAMSLIMADIDHFKHINDKYGHHVGDHAIQFIAKTLQENIRRIDVISRYGGEEFCILMSHCDQDTAKLISERCRIQLQYNPLNIDDEQITVTASFGLITVNGQDIEHHQLSEYDLLTHADKALYQAKKSGRNKCVSASLDELT